MEIIPLTKDGHEALKKELEQLKNVERPSVISAIATARAHGDLRENAEYHAARERQSFVEGRIAELEDKLSRSEVVSFNDNKPSNIRFGAWVTLEDEQGKTKKYRLVGELEADIRKNKISVSSPLGRALLGKEENDSVEIAAPGGTKEYQVVSVEY
ncbi:MAG: transcription elongation factor GreA [Deltaproteobacteria bacterium]|nr:transcription elongation factor GreA [Deltaproteobacteria bacterium]